MNQLNIRCRACCEVLNSLDVAKGSHICKVKKAKWSKKNKPHYIKKK